MERFVIIVNPFQPLTIITKRSMLDVTAVLDLPLVRNGCAKSYSIYYSIFNFISYSIYYLPKFQKM